MVGLKTEQFKLLSLDKKIKRLRRATSSDPERFKKWKKLKKCEQKTFFMNNLYVFAFPRPSLIALGENIKRKLFVCGYLCQDKKLNFGPKLATRLINVEKRHFR